MRIVRPAGSDPRFLVKALSEAAGELRELLWNVPRSAVSLRGEPPDEDWTLTSLTYHLCIVEDGVRQQLDAIFAEHEARLSHVDFDDIPDPAALDGLDIVTLVERFGWSRHHTTYLLWDLNDRDWRRVGVHPYRGRVTVAELARDLYQHDLEHLWQARRMVESLLRRQR